MTTETVLSEKDVFNIIDDAIGNPDMESPEDLDSFKVLVRKAEFAVLQSPEVQRPREDTKRLDWIIAQECQIQSLTLGNGTKYRLGWPDDGEAQTEWYACPRAAIDAMKEQP